VTWEKLVTRCRNGTGARLILPGAVKQNEVEKYTPKKVTGFELYIFHAGDFVLV